MRVGVVLTLNASLKVGATSTTVEVTATNGAELQTMNATVGNTLSEHSPAVLPNLGRDVTSHGCAAARHTTAWAEMRRR